jgi:hypothetical protein
MSDKPILTDKEIEHIEDAGMLDKHPVKMIRTRGGFWIAIGKPKGKYREEALAAGSHPAVVKFNLAKQYPEFQPALMKSEGMSDTAVVDQHSHWLSEDLRKSGHDIYSIQDGSRIEFHITQNDSKVASVTGHLERDSIVIDTLAAPSQFSRALAGATAEKAVSCSAVKIRIQGK